MKKEEIKQVYETICESIRLLDNEVRLMKARHERQKSIEYYENNFLNELLKAKTSLYNAYRNANDNTPESEANASQAQSSNDIESK